MGLTLKLSNKTNNSGFQKTCKNIPYGSAAHLTVTRVVSARMLRHCEIRVCPLSSLSLLRLTYSSLVPRFEGANSCRPTD